MHLVNPTKFNAWESGRIRGVDSRSPQANGLKFWWPLTTHTMGREFVQNADAEEPAGSRLTPLQNGFNHQLFGKVNCLYSSSSIYEFELPDIVYLDTSQAFSVSIEYAIETFSGAGFQSICHFRVDTATNHSWSMWPSNFNTWDDISSGGSGAYEQGLDWGGTILNHWYRVTVVFDGVSYGNSSSWTGYVNDLSPTIYGVGNYNNATHKNLFGNSTAYVLGRVRDVRIYNRVLTEKDHLAIYYNPYDLAAPSLPVHIWTEQVSGGTTIEVGTINETETVQNLGIAASVNQISEEEVVQNTGIALQLGIISEEEIVQNANIALQLGVQAEEEIVQNIHIATVVGVINEEEVVQSLTLVEGGDFIFEVGTINEEETVQNLGIAVSVGTVSEEETVQNADIALQLSRTLEEETVQTLGIAVSVGQVSEEETVQNLDIGLTVQQVSEIETAQAITVVSATIIEIGQRS